MKKHRIFFGLAVLILASLACQVFSRGNDTTSPGGGDNSIPTEQGGSSGGGDSASSASGFPITADAYNVIDIGDGSVLYYTNLSLEDVMAFYRDVYVSQGYTERAVLTVVAEGTLSMVFDGDPSGKAIVIQSVDLGDGSRTVSVRLEDV